MYVRMGVFMNVFFVNCARTAHTLLNTVHMQVYTHIHAYTYLWQYDEYVGLLQLLSIVNNTH